MIETEATVEKHLDVLVIYNGLEKTIPYNPESPVRAIVEHAIRAFGITQQPHLLSLFTQAGVELNDNLSAEKAGVKPGDKLLLRPGAVKGG